MCKFQGFHSSDSRDRCLLVVTHCSPGSIDTDISVELALGLKFLGCETGSGFTYFRFPHVMKRDSAP
jgi:hypothetical protein